MCLWLLPSVQLQNYQVDMNSHSLDSGILNIYIHLNSTVFLLDQEVVNNAIRNAILAGYRAIDCAPAYVFLK